MLPPIEGHLPSCNLYAMLIPEISSMDILSCTHLSWQEWKHMIPESICECWSLGLSMSFFTPSFAFVALLCIVLEILVLGLHISGWTLAASSIFRRFIWPFVFLKWVCCTCGVTSWWKCFDCVACPQNNVPQASMKNVSQWNTWGVVLLWATSIQDVYGVSITQTQIPLLTFDFVGFGFFFIEFTSASISSKSSIFAFVSILIKRFFS